MKNGKLLYSRTAQPTLHIPLSTLNLSNGMIMKRIRTLMFVRMIIASAIRELPVLLLHKLIEAVSATRGEVLMYEGRFAMRDSPNVVAVQWKSFRIVGRM